MKFHPGEYADITGNLESVEIWLINHRCRSQRTIFAGISADQYRQTVRIRHGEKLPAAEYTVDHSKHGIAHRNHCRMQIQLLDHNVAFDRLFIQNFAVGDPFFMSEKTVDPVCFNYRLSVCPPLRLYFAYALSFRPDLPGSSRPKIQNLPKQNIFFNSGNLSSMSDLRPPDKIRMVEKEDSCKWCCHRFGLQPYCCKKSCRFSFSVVECRYD